MPNVAAYHLGAKVVEAVLKSLHLARGFYRVDAFSYSLGGITDKWEDACRFEISDLEANQKPTARSSHNWGVVPSDFDLGGLDVADQEPSMEKENLRRVQRR